MRVPGLPLFPNFKPEPYRQRRCRGMLPLPTAAKSIIAFFARMSIENLNVPRLFSPALRLLWRYLAAKHRARGEIVSAFRYFRNIFQKNLKIVKN